MSPSNSGEDATATTNKPVPRGQWSDHDLDEAACLDAQIGYRRGTPTVSEPWRWTGEGFVSERAITLFLRRSSIRSSQEPTQIVTTRSVPDKLPEALGYQGEGRTQGKSAVTR